MRTFAGGEADVLVCTTIIESGLDIPNANTIIIDRADALGPGPALPAPRPGRAEQPARLRLPPVPAPRPALGRGAQAACRPSSTPRSWAPASRSPSPTSRSAAPATSSAASSPATWRTSASTSTRACSPRRSRSGRRACEGRAPVREAAGATVDLPVDAHLPDAYVPDEAQKLELYRRLARARSTGDLAAFRQEVTDRFGPMPPPVLRLVEVAELRPRRRGGRHRLAGPRGGLSSSSVSGAASRAGEAMRLVAGAPLPGVRPGDVTFAAAQVRIRVAARPGAAPGR